MNPDQGFVDLRLNRQGGQTEEGFWPSFTDIMTVVVMIFLLAMLVLLIRNMELMDQLRATMEAEREAATLARLTGEQKDTLALRLHSATKQLTVLQKQLNHLEAQKEQQEAAIASQRHQLAVLEEERNRLQGQDEQQQALLQTRQQELERLNKEHHKLLTQQQQTLESLTTLHNRHQRQSEQLARVQQDLADTRTSRDTIQAELVRERNVLTALHETQSATATALDESRRSAEAQRLELAHLKEQQRKLLDQHQISSASMDTLRKTHDDTSAALASSRRDIQDLHSQLEASRNETSKSELRLSQTQKKLKQLGFARDKLLIVHDNALDELQQARQRAGDAEAELERVQAGQADMLRDQGHLKNKQVASEAALAAARKQAEEMQLRLEIQEQALTQAMARLEQADLSLSGMQEEYSSLKLKYEDLIKPARSAEGRYLVEVRISKEDDRLITRFRESREAKFDIMERTVLEQRLSELQDRHKNGLYIRVIIPEDSGLSYNEAWSFTSSIHGRFDYYYQDQRDTQ